ncbi:MAG: diaminopimelate epimerase [Clostridiales bacterium]|nr:diaminopimelate epimerase [Clostridiales bacterium]
MKFTKMNGLCNDYIFINNKTEKVNDPRNLAKLLTNPYRKIGGDGIVLIDESDKADLSMRIFNADGSEGLMCGNAVRCTGKFAYENLGIKKTKFSVETASGIKTVEIKINGGKAVCATANLGKVTVESSLVTIRICGKKYTGFCVNAGNPHFVTFVKEFPQDLERIGKIIGEKEIFVDGVNVEFVKKDVADGVICMRVCERGSGETLSCGTGATAAFVVCRQLGYVGDSAVTCLPGGNLICYVKDGDYFISGAVEKNFEGEIDI